MEYPEILKFEHKNGNSVRIIEMPEIKSVCVQSRGPDTEWSNNRQFHFKRKGAYMKRFNEVCKALEHVTLTKKVW